MIGNWMLHLPERIDHEHRLAPYVFGALTDESPQVRQSSLGICLIVGYGLWNALAVGCCSVGVAEPWSAEPRSSGGLNDSFHFTIVKCKAQNVELYLKFTGRPTLQSLATARVMRPPLPRS